MAQTSYDFPGAVARAGMPGSSRAALLARVDSYLAPFSYSTTTVTVGGTASDGVYSFTVDGVAVAFERDDSENNDAIAAALAAAGQDVLALQGRFTFSASGAVVTIVAKQHSVDFATVATGQPGTGTLTVAVVSDSDDLVDIPPGLGVRRAAPSGTVRLPSAGTTAADFLGVVRLNEAGIKENDGSAADVFEPGSMLGVQRNEPIWVVVEGAVTAGSNAFWRVQNGTPGAFRADNAGGDAVELTFAQFETSTTGPGLAKLTVRI